jgi:hypothetical protein
MACAGLLGWEGWMEVRSFLQAAFAVATLPSWWQKESLLMIF